METQQVENLIAPVNKSYLGGNATGYAIIDREGLERGCRPRLCYDKNIIADLQNQGVSCGRLTSFSCREHVLGKSSLLTGRTEARHAGIDLLITILPRNCFLLRLLLFTWNSLIAPTGTWPYFQTSESS